MSWSISVPATPHAEFNAAVDAIDSSKVTQGGGDPAVGLVEAVESGKAALKLLGAQIKRSKVGGGASGHCLQPSDGPNYSDSVQASVYGTE